MCLWPVLVSLCGGATVVVKQHSVSTVTDPHPCGMCLLYVLVCVCVVAAMSLASLSREYLSVACLGMSLWSQCGHSGVGGSQLQCSTVARLRDSELKLGRLDGIYVFMSCIGALGGHVDGRRSYGACECRLPVNSVKPVPASGYPSRSVSANAADLCWPIFWERCTGWEYAARGSLGDGQPPPPES